MKQKFSVFNRNFLLIALNIFVPLSVGLLIYLFCYKTTYINTFIENIFRISLPYIYFDNVFHKFLTCWACDMLWAYSLTFALFVCFKDFKGSVLISGIVAAGFACFIETLQQFGIISGTFDVLDIFTEIAAIFFAVIIIKKEFSK